MRIVFMGSPAFALPALQRLIDSEHEVVAVFSQPDRPAGRGRRLRPPPVKELALAHGLPVHQPRRVNRPEAIDVLRGVAPDAVVVAAYGQILKQELLDIPARGSLNIHASLLPKYRGASPVSAAILAGERETGVSIMEVELALDSGPVVAQRALPIDGRDTAGTLSEKLASLGAGLLLEVLPSWASGALRATPQDDSLATYAPPLRREDAVIDWSLPAVGVWRRVRAYNPWPVATTSLAGEALRILEAWPLEDEADVPPGTVVVEGAGLPEGAGFAVRCGSGSLAVLRAQRAGRRPVSGAELLRGYRGLAGSRLGA